MNQKYGLIDLNGHIILPHEYDNIFKMGIDTYVLCKNGKFGGVFFEENKLNWIAQCEYDIIDTLYGDLIFTRKEDYLYYFNGSKKIKHFKKIDVFGNEHGKKYFFAEDDLMYYIISAATEKILWCHEINDKLFFPAGEPYIMFIGEKKELPLFYDWANCNYFFPGKEEKLMIAKGGPDLLKSIIINGENMLNIFEYGDSIEIDGFNDYPNILCDSDDFDSITVEFKITLRGNCSYEERIYTIPHGTFCIGDACVPCRWRDI